MSLSLEGRVRLLEASRYKVVGQLNAHRTLLLTALATIVQRSPAPSKQVLAELRAAWLPVSPQAPKIFPGISPAELGALQQEYEASISGLLADLETQVDQPK